MTDNIKPDEVLDTIGLNCPLPILKAKKVLKGMENGKVLQLASSDPGAVKDFEAFCRTTGNTLLKSWVDDGVYMFLIERVV